MGDNQKFTTVFPKPLVCISGEDRPPLIPYNKSGNCNLENAKEAVVIALSSYNSSCRTEKGDASNTSNLLQFPNSSSYRFKSITCQDLFPNFNPDVELSRKEINPKKDHYLKTIPFVLKNFDLIDPPHQFFEIVYRLNASQIQDFRSAKIFIQTADAIAEEFSKLQLRALNVVYGGAGSHMAPLAVALRMMDLNIIDRASFLYTEVDEYAVDRVTAYLQGSEDLFKNLKIAKENKSPGYEVVFSWEYKGKPITLTFAIKRSEEYINDQYAADGNLYIIHDAGPGTHKNGQFIKQFIRARKAAQSTKPAWVLAEPYVREQIGLRQKAIAYISSQLPVENSWKGLFQLFFGIDSRFNYPFLYLSGNYGCEKEAGKYEFEYMTAYTMQNGALRSREMGSRDPFRTPSDRDSSHLNFHVDQSDAGVFLYKLPSVEEMARSQVLEVNDGDALDAALKKSPKLSLIAFEADWCGVCENYDPFFEELAKKESNQLNFIRAEGIGQLKDKSGTEEDWKKYGIFNYPTVGYFARSGVFIEVEDRHNPIAFLKLAQSSQEEQVSFYLKMLKKRDDERVAFALRGLTNVQASSKEVVDPIIDSYEHFLSKYTEKNRNTGTQEFSLNRQDILYTLESLVPYLGKLAKELSIDNSWHLFSTPQEKAKQKLEEIAENKNKNYPLSHQLAAMGEIAYLKSPNRDKEILKFAMWIELGSNIPPQSKESFISNLAKNKVSEIVNDKKKGMDYFLKLDTRLKQASLDDEKKDIIFGLVAVTSSFPEHAKSYWEKLALSSDSFIRDYAKRLLNSITTM